MLALQNGAPSPATFDERVSAPKGDPIRYTGEILLRTRPKTYRRVVTLLAENRSIEAITHECRVSDHVVRAIKLRQSATIEERKKELAHLVSDIAHIGGARVADKIGKAGVRDAIIGTGVAIDKLVALTSGLPGIQVAVVQMPSDADREERRQLHDKLDAIARKLAE